MEPFGKFDIAKGKLIQIAAAGQERSFSEEIDLIDSLGGMKYLEKALCTDFKDGLPDQEDDI